MQTIGILNQKGGVGKTTTAINLGVALSLFSKRVLLVDLDPQATLTKGLGVELVGDLTQGTYELLNRQEPTIFELSESLAVIPTSIRLAALSKRLFEGVNPSGILRHNLRQLKDRYDVVILDTPPSLERLTINALVASDWVIIPCQCQKYATDGLEDFQNTLSEVREQLNENVQVLAVIPTMYTANRKVEQEALATLQNTFGDLCRPPVPNRVEYVKAATDQRPVEGEFADYWKELAVYTYKKIGL
jgi:chromosome partitioning protein